MVGGHRCAIHLALDWRLHAKSWYFLSPSPGGDQKKTAHRNYGPGPSRAQPLAGRILLSEADGYFGASVGPIWDQVWINLGPSVGQVWIKCEPIWSHSWTKFGQMWAESGPMLGQFETMFF